MMRVVYWSDLHTELNGFNQYIIKNLYASLARADNPEHTFNADVLVMAGDCFVAKQFTGPRTPDNQTQLDFAKRLAECVFPQFKKVLYVPGNHEYYGTSLTTAMPILQQAFAELGTTNLHVLNNDYIVVDDTVFYGTTLWTAVAEHQREALHKGINDVTRIQNDTTHTPQRFRAADINHLHQKSVGHLQSFLARHQTETALADKKLVVISHHAPSLQSLHPLRAQSIPFAYASNLEPLITTNPRIHAWIHGHTHHKVDYRVGNTRILSNPYGGEQEASNHTFNAHATLEL